MKILLVEDDEDKRDQIIVFLNEKFKCDVFEARSFQTGLKAIKERSFDLILFDMTIPTFDITPTESGGRSQPFGGELLLREMQRREINTKALIITQFDLFGKGDEEINLKDLDARLSATFGDIYLGAVQYSIKYTGWKDVLYRKIEKQSFLKSNDN